MTLLEKLEAAAEGSRELDAEIADNCFAHTEFMGRRIVQRIIYPAHVDVETDDGFIHLRAFDIPHYTTSLDAARTLVPEGMICKIGSAPNFYTLVGRPTPAGGFSVQKRYGKFASYRAGSAPLALCIAALRARP